MKWVIRRFVLLVMALSILCAGYVPAGATESQPPVNDNGIISSEVAGITAELFVTDAISAMPELTWTSATQVVQVVTMYDENGNVSAYSCELSTNGSASGYVVVAAYADSTSKILEFSDQSAPIYQTFATTYSTSAPRIIYTGGLNYYVETGSDSVMDWHGNTYGKNNLESSLDDLRTGIMPVIMIDDPFDYADSYYDGPFVHYESRNTFEQYCTYVSTYDFPNLNEHCAPTAITNLLRMIGEYRNVSKVKNMTDEEIFNEVVSIGTRNGFYSAAEGTERAYLSQYIQISFRDFGMNASVSSTNNVTYDFVKNQINNNRPFLLDLYGHPNYGQHSVACFAYTRLKSSSTGYYKSFIKIADGRARVGRYLDLTDVTARSDVAKSITI